MSFYQASLDGIICLSDIEDKSVLMTPNLKRLLYISARVLGPLTVISFKLVDPLLKELLETRWTGVNNDPGLKTS